MISTRQVYRMLGNETLWDLAHDCHAALQQTEIPYAVAGDVAVCLHGYRRNTVDLDLLVRAVDQAQIKTAFESQGFTWAAEQQEFRSADGIPVHFLFAGERSGPGAEARFPDPAEQKNLTIVDGLQTLSLARLIETKLASGEGNMRRTHKDFADVVELIAIHGLRSEYARHLHKSIRKTFRELVKTVR
ncbi:hypothetical protein [Planctomicrobium piriforme]|uniref:Nucleotidyltransferase family protein n=1 Tax=Planctomicrobium piriforme TaxID=1576369 RepID=A0A1I3HPA9_9PLAN|nr:hypothetical protein [Planctomicrobium piriforme]SFI37608.1 hypothetical protein SAMN05421753_108143 [Planctomicrobium piriforme]